MLFAQIVHSTSMQTFITTVYTLTNTPCGDDLLWQTPPTVYSESLKFEVPSDGDNRVYYIIQVGLYIPPSSDDYAFYFVTTEVDDWVTRVSCDGIISYMITPEIILPCQNVVVNLGYLWEGWHLLEIEFVEQWVAGVLKFSVVSDGYKDPYPGKRGAGGGAGGVSREEDEETIRTLCGDKITSNPKENLILKADYTEASQRFVGPKAWLCSFRIIVPSYGDIEHRYKVTTNMTIPMRDRYFLTGYANDFIDDILVDGLLWPHWEWWSGEQAKSIYGWGDGFCYRLGDWLEKDWYVLKFDFGNYEGDAKLEFQVISFTNEKDKIGRPKFWAHVESAGGFPYTKIRDRKFYGGSAWTGNPGISERKIVAVQEIYLEARDGARLLGDAKARLEVGIAWLDFDMGISDTSFAIMINLTYLGGVQKPFADAVLKWVDVGVVVPHHVLKITGLEFKDVHGGKSIINSNYVIVTGALISAATFLASQYSIPVGAMTGIILGGTTVNSIFYYVAGIQETPCGGVDFNDYALWAWWETIGPVSQGNSVSEIIFVRVDPIEETTCGLLTVSFKGEIISGYSSAILWYTIRFPIHVLR